ncbi:phosphogluconate dehydrogenase (NADP(+)-dependent, decarboxylating) [Echinicola strongylocentroti]|uniref:6-phosphogluconate dehydrogenase, decarboxylating n=1 Tax=Echinicola strongylocentroti TaxID=1795355 RepID=A0A2Z4INK5_9BACT|nr:NADP-dependent phosphogluconate dehydrogenase [Echinicola strongylocentroti]AWW32357.1 phosphogluconate dehydrogenase (NADP(+)-dependent, decarboxylating) [Echinicola strongylocentroti]
MEQFDFGIVGLGVMGRNLLLNMADNGFAVAGLDLDETKAKSLEKEAASGHQVKGFIVAEDFVKSLKKPKAIMVLVPAGKPVDAVISSIRPFLSANDIVVDGGNSYFPDTDRRFSELAKDHIHFFGMGISGGEKGARFGPSMMPGGDEKAYERLRPVFEAIAAKVDGEPCVTYLGKGSAGNYVKMVHNGIEYGIMQLIAETYDVMKRGLGIGDERIQEIFETWNTTELSSFLVEITATLLKKKDKSTGQQLVTLVSDRARSKGTGKWTSQNAMDLQAPVPVIDMAVLMRDISKYKEERVAAAKLLPWEAEGEEDVAIESLKDALYFAIITTYAQGMVQLKLASDEYKYGLNLEEVAKIWRGGCIIRAACLEDFRQAYRRDSALANLLLDEKIAEDLVSRQGAAREVIKVAVDKGVPVPALMAALAYFDAYRSETLATNVIQAQRDYFGAHQFERIDKEGLFHVQWDEVTG